MTQKTYNYAKALYALSVSGEAVSVSEERLKSSKELRKVLENPLVSDEEKDRVIQRIFPEEIWNFMKYLCRKGMVGRSQEIFQLCAEYARKKERILEAVLYYVTKPDQEQLDGIRKFLKHRFHASQVTVSLVEKPELMGGFLLQAGGREYDWSVKGRIEQLTRRLIRR